MKRLLLNILSLLICLAATAQTDFRHISYKEALTAAQHENKLVFMDFYTDWCGPCKMMMREVFPQKSVGDYMNKTFVAIKVNAEKDDGVELAKKYQVKAYPTFVIIDATETEKGRVVGSSSPESFINKLEQIVDPSKAPEVIKKKYESGDRTPDVVKSYAVILMDEFKEGRHTREEYMEKYAEVNKLVQDYYEKLPTADRVKEENMFVYRQYTTSPFDASGRFLYTSLDKFSEQQKAEADSLRTNLYRQSVLRCLMGEEKLDATQFATLKSEIKQLGIDKESNLQSAYTLIEGAMKGDNAGYLSLCEKEFNNLSDLQKEYLIEGFGNNITNADEATKQQAAKFLRAHIGELSIGGMYSAMMQISSFEGNGH